MQTGEGKIKGEIWLGGNDKELETRDEVEDGEF